MSTVVVDASVVVKWVLEEPYSTEAIALLNQWAAQDHRILAPSLLAYEVTNALYKRVVRGELSLDEAQAALADVLSTGPELATNEAASPRALELAHQFHRPSSYDAHYLALAVWESCDFWTADERLWNAVRATLPWVHWIGEPRRQT